MREFTEKEKSLIKRMYSNGERFDDIRKALHCNEDLLRRFMKNNGYVRRKRNSIKGKEALGASRKYFLNERYFQTIDTEQKAYWLGFLYADGSVYKSKSSTGIEKGYRIELTLKADDVKHLRLFNNCLLSDYPLIKKEVKLNDKIFIAYRICINSVLMAKDLINHGCVENKSLILQAPDFLPNHLIRHFIRGYFDGDGCVSYNYDTHCGIYSILGTYEILNFIKKES